MTDGALPEWAEPAFISSLLSARMGATREGGLVIYGFTSRHN